jgi:hypothetical protein
MLQFGKAVYACAVWEHYSPESGGAMPNAPCGPAAEQPRLAPRAAHVAKPLGRLL